MLRRSTRPAFRKQAAIVAPPSISTRVTPRRPSSRAAAVAATRPSDPASTSMISTPWSLKRLRDWGDAADVHISQTGATLTDVAIFEVGDRPALESRTTRTGE